MTDTIILASIRFCSGGREIGHGPDYNADYNADYRIGEETPENEE